MFEDELSEIAELDRLSEQNKAALARVQALGARVDGMGEHYIITMLETLLGAATLNGMPLLSAAKLAHERWMVDALAATERTAQSAVDARAKWEAQQRAEAIRRGAPSSVVPPGPAPVLKNADFLNRAVAKTDAQAKRQ
jgi:hypothetical protein